MQNKLVSIVVNSYNGADFLEPTLDSILAQTYKNLEIILVDDGSKDNTFDIMRAYGKKDDRIRAITQKNGGPSSSRDLGYKYTTGDYILFADDDDIILPDMVENMLSKLDKYPEAKGCCTFCVDVDSDKMSEYDTSNNIGMIQELYPEVTNTIDGLDVLLLRRHRNGNCYICCAWGVLYRREYMNEVVPKYYQYKETMPEYYFDDTMTAYLTMVEGATFAITDMPYILYRVDNNSISHGISLTNHCKRMMYPVEEHALYYKNLGRIDEYKEEILGLYLILIRTYIIMRFYVNDEAEKKQYYSEIERLYQEYLPELKRFSYSGKDATMKKMVLTWHKCPTLVGFIVRKIRGW